MTGWYFKLMRKGKIFQYMIWGKLATHLENSYYLTSHRKINFRLIKDLSAKLKLLEENIEDYILCFSHGKNFPI